MTSTLLFQTARRTLSLLSNSCPRSSSLLLPLKSYGIPHSQNVLRSQQNCTIHTSPRRNAPIPPPILLMISRVAQFGSALVGHTARTWWKNLTPEQKVKLAARARRNRYLLFGVLGGFSMTSYLYYITHLEETPITNRKRFLALSHKQFEEMAKDEVKELILQNKWRIVQASSENPLYHRISSVVKLLLNAAKQVDQLPQKDWTITVINDDDQCNAFVFPSGNIFVFSGILELCETDDELAFILGHELAHAILGHGAEKASVLHFFDSLMVIPLAVLWTILPTDLTAVVGHSISQFISTVLMALPHSRQMEEEADRVGLMFATLACYDVRQAPTLWRKMRLAEESDPEDEIEWLSTHPTHESREATLASLVPQALETRRDCKCCPELPPYNAELNFLAYSKKIQQQQKYQLPVKV